MQDIDKHSTFAMLPRDLSQQIFNELVNSNRLTEASLQIFRDCALQVKVSVLICLAFLQEYAPTVSPQKKFV